MEQLKEPQGSEPQETGPTAAAVEQTAQKRGRRGRVAAAVRGHFTATHIAYMAIFTALAFAVSFLEFPIFPPASFLKLDFANVFFMIEGFIFGPVEAVISIGIKELLCLTKSTTGGAGEVANFLMSAAYIIVPSVGYRFLKGRKWVTLFLGVACAVQIGVSMLVNRYINFPLYGALSNFDGAAAFLTLWPFVLYFNLIKSIAVSAIVFLIYKPLSRFMKSIEQRLRKKRARPSAEEENGRSN